jgi:hypothetical protein
MCTAVLVLTALVATTDAGGAECGDLLGAVGCSARIASHPEFCESVFATDYCCASCALAPSRAAVAVEPGCAVPRQKCVVWDCEQPDTRLAPGTKCHVVAKQTPSCKRCAVVDAESCESFVSTVRTCQMDGSWTGSEPACRRYCDETYQPPADDLPQLDWDALAAMEQSVATAPLAVVPITAPPFGHYLKSRNVDEYMSDRIDVFGQWLVMFTKVNMRAYYWLASPGEPIVWEIDAYCLVYLSSLFRDRNAKNTGGRGPLYTLPTSMHSGWTQI